MLTEAIQDEYKALATYQKVIEKFGAVRSFIYIVEAESRHADALQRQFERLGVDAPKNEWAGQVEAPDSILDACEDAVNAEIENAGMYDRLLAQVDDHAIRKVLLNLQDASQNRHLPAFQRCRDRQQNSARRSM